ncbi:MAG: NAD(P)/FAD-dependent oxidoreductase [Candidatus Altiarchaeota archaeon]
MKKIYDVIIAGCGPAGLSAGLRAKELNLNFLILERERVCNFISENYIQGKEVSCVPDNLELKGNLWFKRCKVENLLEKWQKTARMLNIHENEEVLNVEKRENFLVKTNKSNYYAKNVIVAIGKEAKPRKLNVKGENLKKVFYKLKNPNEFKGKKVLIVGGGDSAIEAALELCKENKVSISYRREKFFRLNEENSKKIDEAIKSKALEVIFSSNVKEIKERSITLEVFGKEKEIENDYIFIFAGSELPIEFFKRIENLKIENDKVILDENFQTNIKGLFVIGDASGKPPFVIKNAINQGYDVVNFISKNMH